MRAAALCFVLLSAALSAFADPTVTSITPSVGLVYAQTEVTISGSGFSESEFDCRGDNAPFCPVTVLLGSEELRGEVLNVTPTTIRMLVPPRPHATVVDVTVRVVRNGEVSVRNGFRWLNSATSTDPNHYDRYLVPVIARDVPGAGGSLWWSELTLRNAGFNAPFTIICPCPDSVAVIPLLSSIRPQLAPRGDGAEGAYIYVPKDVQAGMSLRVRDVSRNAQSFGDEIPIASERGYRSPLHLVDVPTDPQYRATLRIYDGPEMVEVGVYTDDGREIERYWVELRGVVHAVPEKFPLHPVSYAQVDLLTPAVRAAGGRVHVAVYSVMLNTGISPPPPIPVWGFISLTNNATQQVTVISPQR